jgi:hypothetical protein
MFVAENEEKEEEAPCGSAACYEAHIVVKEPTESGDPTH